MTERKKIRRRIEPIAFKELTGSIPDVIGELRRHMDTHGNMSDLHLACELEKDGYPARYCLFGFSLETDEEFENRLHAERCMELHREKLAAKKERRERATFERLAKKYSNIPTEEQT